MRCNSKNFQHIEKFLRSYVDNLVFQRPLKFQVDRIKIVRVLLLAELKNAVLRKSVQPALWRSTRKTVTLKIKYF